MEYLYKIRVSIGGKLQCLEGSVLSQIPLVTANDIFQAIERSLPTPRAYEDFSIMEFRKKEHKKIIT